MAKKIVPTPTHEEVAHCAYLVYEGRGREPGSDREDWLEAEAQLIADHKQEAGLKNRKTSSERRAPWENVQPAETIMTNHSKS